MTEREVLVGLKAYLERTGWTVKIVRFGRTHGVDLEAERDGQLLWVEAKGARAESPVRSRDFFDRDQIKTQFGMALVTALQYKQDALKPLVGIAHPVDEAVQQFVAPLVPYVLSLGIKHFWVSAAGEVREE